MAKLIISKGQTRLHQCRLNDYIGKENNWLTVVGNGYRKGKSNYWHVKCRCGHHLFVEVWKFTSGHTKSCGCLRIHHIVETGHGNRGMPSHNKTHGKTGSAEYRVWSGMKTRCTNPNCKSWHDYGGRGITVCERWLHSFENFLADMGLRPSAKHSLDRFPNKNGNYELGNCRWATHIQQARNRRTSRELSFRGEVKTISEWSAIVGIRYDTILMRLDHFHWTVEEALTIPVETKRRKVFRTKPLAIRS